MSKSSRSATAALAFVMFATASVAAQWSCSTFDGDDGAPADAGVESSVDSNASAADAVVGLDAGPFKSCKPRAFGTEIMRADFDGDPPDRYYVKGLPLTPAPNIQSGILDVTYVAPGHAGTKNGMRVNAVSEGFEIRSNDVSVGIDDVACQLRATFGVMFERHPKPDSVVSIAILGVASPEIGRCAVFLRYGNERLVLDSECGASMTHKQVDVSAGLVATGIYYAVDLRFDVYAASATIVFGDTPPSKLDLDVPDVAPAMAKGIPSVFGAFGAYGGEVGPLGPMIQIDQFMMTAN